ncbi:MerR family DNA-binding protein [Streptomyces cirratus]
MVLRKCQQAGLTLAEIGEFQEDQATRQAMIRAKIAEVEQRMIDLDHAHQLLVHALRCRREDIVHLPEVPRADGGLETPSG